MQDPEPRPRRLPHPADTKAPVINTLGCGDAFAAGFTAAHFRGIAPQTTAQDAVAMATKAAHARAMRWDRLINVGFCDSGSRWEFRSWRGVHKPCPKSSSQNGGTRSFVILSGPMGDLLGYVRVSTTEQNSSLQIDALEAAGCSCLFVDQASGALDERIELGRLFDHGDLIGLAVHYGIGSTRSTLSPIARSGSVA